METLPLEMDQAPHALDHSKEEDSETSEEVSETTEEHPTPTPVIESQKAPGSTDIGSLLTVDREAIPEIGRLQGRVLFLERELEVSQETEKKAVDELSGVQDRLAIAEATIEAQKQEITELREKASNADAIQRELTDLELAHKELLEEHVEKYWNVMQSYERSRELLKTRDSELRELRNRLDETLEYVEHRDDPEKEQSDRAITGLKGQVEELRRQIEELQGSTISLNSQLEEKDETIAHLTEKTELQKSSVDNLTESLRLVHQAHSPHPPSKSLTQYSDIDGAIAIDEPLKESDLTSLERVYSPLRSSALASPPKRVSAGLTHSQLITETEPISPSGLDAKVTDLRDTVRDLINRRRGIAGDL